MSRCSHGFVGRLCREPTCPHWDGLTKEPETYSVPCQSCGGRIYGAHGKRPRGFAVGERICAPCVARVQADHQRRESQEAWFYGGARWW